MSNSNISKVIHKVKVDFTKRTIQDRVNLVQYDTNGTIRVDLYSNGIPYFIPSDSTKIYSASLKYTKRDGHYIIKSPLNSILGSNYLLFDITRQMTALDCETPATVTIYESEGSNTSHISTGNFILNIEHATVNSTAIKSDDEYDTFDEIQNIKNHVDAKSDHVDSQVDHVDSQVEHVDAQVEHVDAQVEHVDTKSAHVDAKSNHVDSQVEHIDAQVEHVDAQINAGNVLYNNMVKEHSDAVNDIQNAHNAANASIESNRQAAVKSVNDTKNAANASIESNRQAAVKSVNDAKDAANASIESNRQLAIKSVNDTKDDINNSIKAAGQAAVKSVNDTKNAANASIESTRQAAVKSVNDTKDAANASMKNTVDEYIAFLKSHEQDFVPYSGANKNVDLSGLTLSVNNLVVTGNITKVDANTVSVNDLRITLAKNNTVALTQKAGIIIPKYNGKNYGGIVMGSDGIVYVGDVDSNGNPLSSSGALPVVVRHGTFTNGHILKWDSNTLSIVDSGYTIAKSVPANADFANTWRPVINNLTSTDTSSSLSAAMGKKLNDEKMGNTRSDSSRVIYGKYLVGESGGTDIYHRIEVGSPGSDVMNFDEYAGVFKFHNTSSGSRVNTTTLTADGGTILTSVNTKSLPANGGTADYAKLLSVHNVTSTDASSWNELGSGYTLIWGQRFINSGISSDSGDMVLALRAGFGGGTELCMSIDGGYFVHGDQVALAKNVLPKAGGIISGGGSIGFNSGGLSTFGGSALAAANLAIGYNGIAISSPSTKNDSAAIFTQSIDGNEKTKLVIALGDDGTSSDDNIVFRYYNTSGNYSETIVPHKSGTLATLDDISGSLVTVHKYSGKIDNIWDSLSWKEKEALEGIGGCYTATWTDYTGGDGDRYPVIFHIESSYYDNGDGDEGYEDELNAYVLKGNYSGAPSYSTWTRLASNALIRLTIIC